VGCRGGPGRRGPSRRRYGDRLIEVAVRRGQDIGGLIALGDRDPDLLDRLLARAEELAAEEDRQRLAALVEQLAARVPAEAPPAPEPAKPATPQQARAFFAR
jgi:hypothetical protein